MDQTTIYSRFTRFLLPLAITLIVVELSGQVLSAGMARVPQATETLAAYGVAWGLITLVVSPLTHAKALSLVLADSTQARQKTLQFVLLFGFALMLALVALSLTPLGYWVIEEMHGVSRTLGDTVRLALVWLIPAPLLKGLAHYYTGLLMRTRHTVIVSVANVASIGSGIALVFLLLPTQLIQQNPIWLPILATYLNMFVELGIVLWGHWRLQGSGFSRAEINVIKNDGVETERPPLTFAAIIHFIWPLSLNIAFQEFSRPLINIYISRATDGLEALAILTVAYALGQFPYRWLNDIRNLATAFQDEQDSLYYIRRFAAACGLISLAMMLGLFWTPLRVVILQTLMGLDAEFAASCRLPLMLFAIFSPVVTLRAYSQGIALKEKRTYVIAICAPTRLAAVWLTLVTLPLVGIFSATLGVAALAAGFFIEALTIWWGVRGHQWFMHRRLTSSASSITT